LGIIEQIGTACLLIIVALFCLIIGVVALIFIWDLIKGIFT